MKLKIEKDEEIIKVLYNTGYTLAMIVSFSLHKSIFSAIVHGFFSWVYVFYYLLTN